MNPTIIGRESPTKQFKKALRSKRAELIAVYGRRRVGKTYLVTKLCAQLKDALYFQLTGSLKEDGQPIPISEWLTNFSLAYYASFNQSVAFPDVEACLRAILELAKRAQVDNKLFVLFIDELPWLAQSCPPFYRGFVNLWNNTLVNKPLVKIVVAGSATSWMMDNVVQARTAMAKRITRKIHLRPFDFYQTRDFLKHKGLRLQASHFFQLYSALGGIPYYLEALDHTKSVRENLHSILIDSSGILGGDYEYEQLFRYLFTNHHEYDRLTTFIAEKKYGTELREIASKLEANTKASGALNKRLENLKLSEIIDERVPFLSKSRGKRFFVSDEFIRFHSKWLRNRSFGSLAAFTRLFDSPEYRSWQGFDFELSIYKNYHLITELLRISGMAITPHIYYHDTVQIDLLLERADDTVTICEAKSTDLPYKLTAEDVRNYLIRRENIIELYKRKRKRPPHINCCFIVKNGLADNSHRRDLDPLVADLSHLAIS